MPQRCVEEIEACWPFDLPPGVLSWIDLRCRAGVPAWVIWFAVMRFFSKRERLPKNEMRRVTLSLIAIEQNPDKAEAVVADMYGVVDLALWKQLLELAIKLWPELDDEFLLALSDAFVSGYIKPESLAIFIGDYRKALAQKTAEPTSRPR